MKCNQCAHEQTTGLFCSTCGTPLEQDQHVQEELVSVHERENIHKEAYEQSTQTNSRDKKLQLDWSIHGEWKTVLLYVIPSVIICIGVSWGISVLLQSSSFIKDMTYSVLVAEEALSSSQVATIIAHISITLWDVILVSHSGSAVGTLSVEGIESLAVQWKIPVIIAPIIGMIMLATISRMFTKIRPVKSNKEIHVWLISTFIYAIIMTILLKVFAPTYESNGIEFVLSVSFLQTFLHTCLIGGISFWIGLRMWKYPIWNRTYGSTWFRALRPVGLSLLIWFIVAVAFQMVAWFFMHPSANFAIPLLSPSSLWGLYETDIMFYMLLPTYFIGELLYGLGATFHLTSTALTNAFQMYSMDLHAWLGVDVKESTEGIKPYQQLIESATRFSWGALICIVIYVYAIFKTRLLSIKEHLLQVLTIGVVAFLLAYGTTIAYKSGTSAKGIIGFSPLATSLIVMVVTTIVIVVKYVVVTSNAKRKHTNGGETSGDL